MSDLVLEDESPLDRFASACPSRRLKGKVEVDDGDDWCRRFIIVLFIPRRECEQFDEKQG
jgi:hypothetical protein